MGEPAAWWGEGTYERLAERFAEVHDELVAALAAQPGERWLDAATGTGAVALRAAQAGADVTAFDFSPVMIEKAAATLDGLGVRLDVADAQAMPYPDAAFDVVVSCFGVIFAPDRERVAAELARVCRPGGRLGLTAWLPDTELDEAWEPLIGSEPLPVDLWGRPGEVERLLEDDFDLTVQSRTWWLTASSGNDAWSFLSESAPPIRALLAAVGEETRAALREAFVEVHERHRSGEGTRYPMQFFLVTGIRSEGD
jgi:ubiquinone/menaquinone biosynthesis C-methylase UbiE